MYDRSDPRFALQTSGAPSAAPPTVMPEAHVARFYEEACQEDTADGKTWYQRGQTFLLTYSEAKPGAVFSRGSDQRDEYVVLLDDPNARAIIRWSGVEVEVPGHSIAFVPQGASSVAMPDGGQLVRLFTERATDLLAKCPNNDAFTSRQPNIPELRAWPEPADGLKVRHYSLDVAPEPGRFGRIFRCTTFMVNVFDPAGPRDPRKMSPHHHDDFEQCSLALAGAYDHLLRWPWTPDMTTWKADAREHCSSPSSTIIPPPVIHTSLALSEVNRLVDIFCPPRRDFSEKAGWVLNADDYPMPAA
ncbi:conserved hypothetical protein [Hyphomicrobiales bacterium]|nr:conserved hypothetical protein [Hyphomicrobiales bacterium]CAH1675525.1 conserved hypothetical protein [Hyphomicrobiales bacterium]